MKFSEFLSEASKTPNMSEKEAISELTKLLQKVKKPFAFKKVIRVDIEDLQDDGSLTFVADFDTQDKSYEEQAKFLDSLEKEVEKALSSTFKDVEVDPDGTSRGDKLSYIGFKASLKS